MGEKYSLTNLGFLDIYIGNLAVYGLRLYLTFVVYENTYYLPASVY